MLYRRSALCEHVLQRPYKTRLQEANNLQYISYTNSINFILIEFVIYLRAHLRIIGPIQMEHTRSR